MADLRGRALFAYVVVCVVWGSTYLAIRLGVAELPPFLFGGARFLAAAALLLPIALWRRDAWPRQRAEWATLAVAGTLFFLGGNGLVIWAEQTVDSGAASIYVVTVAIWAATFDALVPGGTTPFTLRLVVGLVLGLLGTVVLTGVTPAQLVGADLRGPIALVCASASWGFGTVLLKRRKVAAGMMASVTVQTLAGGLALTALGLVRGEAMPWPLSLTAWGALAYLVVFGSVIGFTAYAYALRHTSATVVGTYAYVNPVVAVLLGWLLLNETMSVQKVLGMAVIIGAVLWIRRATSQGERKRTEANGGEPGRAEATPGDVEANGRKVARPRVEAA